MTLSLEELATIYPEHLWFELSAAAQTAAWDGTQAYSNPTARWNAYLNLLCLQPFIHYLQDHPKLQPLPLTVCCNDAATSPQSWGSSIWEFVNGTALTLGQTRLALFPQEIGMDDELCVPQEWVDIDAWAVDYYLAFQVNLEEHWGRVWGYTTHRKLKQTADYDAMDRTYTLARDELIADLDVLWLARERCVPERLPLPARSSLNPAQTENLLVRLGQPSPGSPRRDLPFDQWGALLADDRTRQELYQRRLGEFQPVLLPLRRWLNVSDMSLMERLRTAGWQRDRDVFGTAAAFRFAETANREAGNREAGNQEAGNRGASIRWVKPIELELESPDRALALILTLDDEGTGIPEETVETTEETIWILPQVCFLPPVDPDAYLPFGLKLQVIDEESGAIFKEVQVEGYSNLINLDAPFKGAPGDPFSIAIAIGDRSYTERFTI